MVDLLRALYEFHRQFPNDAARASCVVAKRWPEGFRCPACGEPKCWPLSNCTALTFRSVHCGKGASVTVGTIMHVSHLPLIIWFWAAHLMATRSNDMSTLQLRSELGLGSYKTAWLLAMKLRHAMVARRQLSCDAVLFMKASIVSDTTVKTDGTASYFGAPDINYERHVIGTKAAHMVMPAVGRMFSNLKTWGVSVYQGLRRKYLQVYHDEFVFRFNRRKARHAAFTSLLPSPWGVFPSPTTC